MVRLWESERERQKLFKEEEERERERERRRVEEGEGEGESERVVPAAVRRFCVPAAYHGSPLPPILTLSPTLSLSLSRRPPPCFADVAESYLPLPTPGERQREIIREREEEESVVRESERESERERGREWRWVDTLVIAHCDESLDWIPRLGLASADVALYRKCKRGREVCKGTEGHEPLSLSPTPFFPLPPSPSPSLSLSPSPRHSETSLCNTGEEAAAYLTHIIDNYDSLSHGLFFLQGGPERHSPLLGSIFSRLSRANNSFVSLATLYTAYNASGEPSAPLSTLLPTSLSTLPLGYEHRILPNVQGSFCCGMFYASRAAIRARSLFFWKKMRKLADGSLPPFVAGDERRRHEAGVFERSWHLALGEDIIQAPYIGFSASFSYFGLHGYRDHLSAGQLLDEGEGERERGVGSLI
jgi:hypothetical protein